MNLINFAEQVPADLALKIVRYMMSRNDVLSIGEGTVNVVYLEGANIDGAPNDDRAGRWNDMSYLLAFRNNKWVISFAHIATTEPGVEPTRSLQAKQRGGVARIALGQQFFSAVGFHKGDPKHPALVQVAPVKVHRDWNQDGFRTGDPITGAGGINDHGTRPGYTGSTVGFFSEGCRVRWSWDAHLEFMRQIHADPRVIDDPKIILPTAVYGADSLAKFLKLNP